MLRNWLMEWKQLGRIFSKPTRLPRRDRTRPVGVPVQAEVLENRILLAVFTVDTTADVIAEDGDVSLREAIQAANTNSAVNADVGAGDLTGDTIIFDTTVFAPANSATISLDSLLGPLEINDDLVIDGGIGDGTLPTSVRINGQDLTGILQIATDANPAIGQPVELANLTLTNGNTTGNGGAIQIADREDVTLSNLTITNNTADGSGGGIANGDGKLTINGGMIQSNSAGTRGGGIANNGSDLTAFDVTVSGNTASVAGGGIETGTTGDRTVQTTLVDVTVTGNSAGVNGGGVHVTAPTSLGAHVLQINDGRFSNNTAAQEGGGLWNDANGVMTVNGATITNNTAQIANAANDAQGGGGVFNNGGVVTMSNATIQNNQVSGTSGGADDGGGGIFNDGRNNDGATVTLNNVTINGNQVQSTSLNGGGVLNIGSAENNATVNINNGIVANNSAARAGGGIESSGGIINLNGVSVTSNAAGVNGGGVHVTGADVTTVNGGAFVDNTAGQEGGGLWNSATGVMTIEGTNIESNIANIANAANDAQGGGGVFNNGGTLEITDATISSNLVSGGSGGADDGGGGIFNDGRNTMNATVTLTNVTITDNDVSGTSLNGGGVLNIGSAETDAALNIVGGTIDSNTAVRAGGGIESNNGTLNLTDVLVSGNSAGVNGGGLHVTAADTTTITGGEFRSNTAGQEGGGLWNSATGTMTIDDAEISGNTALIGNAAADAQGGGGVFNNGGTLDITNATISENVVSGSSAGADDGGGGIFNDGRSTMEATVTLNNVTITGNDVSGTSLNGGGVLNIGSAENDATINIVGGTIEGNTAVRAGGGIESNNGTVNLTDVLVSDNSAGINGGGLHVTGADETNVTGGTFRDNTAGQEGGGLWNSATGTMTLTDVMILENTAEAGNTADAQGGGGVFNNGGTVTLSGGAIRRNVVSGELDPTDGGGGIFNDGRSTGSAVVSITNTTISNNEVSDTTPATIGGRGGGILNIGSSITGAIVNATDSSIQGNTAPQAGGGIETNTGTLNLMNTTITGNSTGANGGGIHVQADDSVNVTGGTISGNTAGQEGGGLWNSATGSMTITDVTISGNTALAGNPTDAQGGGGVFNNGGTVTLSGGTISSNVVTGILDSTDGGGGIFNDARNTDGAAVNITGTVIINNDVIHTGSGFAGRGGGVLNIADNSNSGTVSMTGGSISGNNAEQAGGGIELRVLNSDTLGLAGGSITLDNVVLNANSTDNNGGAVHLGGTLGTLSFTATESTFSNNSAGNEGGGLWNESNSDATLTLNSSTVNGNSSPNGGGLFQNDDGTPGTINISNSTVSGNVATTGGGIDSEGGNLNIEFSTIAFNFASTGGGLNLEAGTTATLSGSLVGNNAAGTGPDVAGLLATVNFSLVSNSSDLTINTGGGILLDVAPELGPLQDNGGPTLTHALLSGSPAINAGDPSPTSPPSFDQRGEGFDRIIGGRIDIGAFESDLDLLAVGTGPGTPATVTVFNAMSGDVLRTITPYGGFGGGVRVATGDVNGDGVTDVITGAGPGGGPHVKVFDGTDGSEIRSFFGFAAGFAGGVFVASADFNNDGLDDIVVSADAGGGPHVRVLSGADSTELFGFFAYDLGFAGGVRVAVGDISNDGIPDIITAPGPGGGPHIRIFSGADLSDLGGFFAYTPGFSGGVFVAAGNVGGDDGRVDIITGAGAGGGPHVRVFDGADNMELFGFFAYDAGFTGGVRVTANDLTGDGLADVITVPGAGGGPHLRAFDATAPNSIIRSIFVGDPAFTGGLFAAGDPELFNMGQTLLLAGPSDSSQSADTIGLADVQPVFDAALLRLESAGLSQAQVDSLGSLSIQVADLSGIQLGIALAGRIVIDQNAAGVGWYLDPTPIDDDEFESGAAVDSAAMERVDLLTVVLHELGHHFGGMDLDFEDDPAHFMAEALFPGQRRVPRKEDLDELFSDPSFLDSH